MEVHAILKKHGKMKVYVTLFKKPLVQEGNARGHSLQTGMYNFVCMKLLRALRQINVFIGFYSKESLVLIRSYIKGGLFFFFKTRECTKLNELVLRNVPIGFAEKGLAQKF